MGGRQCGVDHRRHRHRLLDLAPDVRTRAPAAARHRAVEPLRRGRPQAPVAVADPADALPAGLHHRRRRTRGLHRRRLCVCGYRARRDRLGCGDPHRRGDQAHERARHRRPVLGGSRQVRLRLGRPSHGMPDVGAWLGRGRAVARSRRHAAQRRYRRRHHQTVVDREWTDPRHRGDRGRRPADRRGTGRPHARRTAGEGRRAGARYRPRRLASRSQPPTRNASSSAWRGCSWA